MRGDTWAPVEGVDGRTRNGLRVTDLVRALPNAPFYRWAGNAAGCQGWWGDCGRYYAERNGPAPLDLVGPWVKPAAEPAEPAPQPDPVNHPPHYTYGKYEVIDVLEDWFPDDPLLWQVGKYIARCWRKGNALEDLRKAEFYLKRRIAMLERDEQG